MGVSVEYLLYSMSMLFNRLLKTKTFSWTYCIVKHVKYFLYMCLLNEIGWA